MLEVKIGDGPKWSFLNKYFNTRQSCSGPFLVWPPLPLLIFRNLPKKWGGSDFSHKKGGVGKTGRCLQNRVSLIFVPTNPFQCYLSLSVCCVCVCVCVRVCVSCLSIPFQSVLFLFHGKSLVLLNLINRYVTSIGE